MQPPPLPQSSSSQSQSLYDEQQAPQTDAAHRQPTPPPPTYSPVTPEMSTSFLAAPEPDSTLSSAANHYPYTAANLTSFQDPSTDTYAHRQARTQSQHPGPSQEPPQPPAPEPISLEDNTDAIALRAAMSVLQMQRQQALKDMRTLQQQKTRAAADPEGFAKALVDGGLKMRSTSAVLFAGSDGEDDENREETGQVAGQAPGQPLQNGELGHADFGHMEIPGAQNVIRMPPINWAKYHIVGKSLDRLHKEQRLRPTTAGVPNGTRREAEVAAPYDPFVDKLDVSSKVDSTRTLASGVISSSITGPQAEAVNTRRKSGGVKKS